MVHAFALLLVLQLVGEVAVKALGLPLPGPLVGMMLLFAALAVRGGLPPALASLAEALLRHMMLLFIPAVAGVMLHAERFAGEGLPFLAACLLGAGLTMAVTALTLAGMLRLTGAAAADDPDATVAAAADGRAGHGGGDLLDADVDVDVDADADADARPGGRRGGR